MGKKYTEEFKREALRVCEQQGVRATSEKLGIPSKTLYLWQRTERLGVEQQNEIMYSNWKNDKIELKI